jgi:hypothetical protein
MLARVERMRFGARIGKGFARKRATESTTVREATSGAGRKSVIERKGVREAGSRAAEDGNRKARIRRTGAGTARMREVANAGARETSSDAVKDARWKSAYVATGRNYQDLVNCGLRRCKCPARITDNGPTGSVRCGLRREQETPSDEQRGASESTERVNSNVGGWNRRGEWRERFATAKGEA